MTTTAERWRNRVVKRGSADPRTLRANALNWRVHPPEQRAALIEVLETVGWVREAAIVNLTTGNMLDGHLRVDVAIERGEKRVPTQYVELSEDEERLVLATLDTITGMAEVNTETLDALLRGLSPNSASAIDEMLRDLAKQSKIELFPPAAGLTAPDDVPPEPTTVYVKRGQRYALGAHVIMCGDTTDEGDAALLLGDTLVDCVFTSPPYGVGVEYGTYEDTIENLRVMLPLLARHWTRVVRPGGFAVVNFGDIVSGRLAAALDEPCEYPMALEYFPVFRAAGWVLWSRRAWCKPNARVHSPWSIQSNRAASDWEHIWTFKREGERAFIGRAASSANGWFDTTHEMGVEIGKETHGAGMAVAPAERMLTIHSERDGAVFEPFLGTGTTLIAAERLGRQCFGMEIEPKYVQMTIERWQNYTGQKATPLSPARSRKR